MQIQDDGARIRIAGNHPLVLDKPERLATVPKDLEFISLSMLIQGMAKQEHVSLVVFHDQDSCWAKT